ncbi:hypothetical protein RGQ13_08700 [Thalassotalea psychrophila]|uniref:Uncharacterized protein n=1 Tax=Thalassotalea psychrophila TaxID=3065647 RepID=A0ABY9TZM9_9GAMM|nr:hypothetical protein RGQ13_08700 [Colwelliaceae bacterium SQ149]
MQPMFNQMAEQMPTIQTQLVDNASKLKALRQSAGLETVDTESANVDPFAQPLPEVSPDTTVQDEAWNSLEVEGAESGFRNPNGNKADKRKREVRQMLESDERFNGRVSDMQRIAEAVAKEVMLGNIDIEDAESVMMQEAEALFDHQSKAKKGVK